MARLARLVVPDVAHHVTQRGNRRQPVFFSDKDYAAYRDLVAAACATHDVRCLAWCLMPNHVHLILVPTTEDGLRAAIAETHRRYSWIVNRRQEWQGHLWQDRFASFPMDEPHLVACARYVELNPVRAGLARFAEDWPWSSARVHLGLGDDGITDRRPLADRVDDWAAWLAGGETEHERDRIRAHIRSGRPLGGERFLRRLEMATGRSLLPKRRGRPAKWGQ